MAPYLAVFLDGRGFTSLEIGEILAVVTATKVFGPTLWAVLADKTGKQLSIIRLGAFLACFAFFFLFFLDGYWPLLISLALFSLFWTAILPQIEVLTLTSIRRSPKIYARIRLWGSIGFIAFAMLAGELIERYGAEVYIAIGMVILLGLFISSMQLTQRRLITVHQTSSESIFNKLYDYRFVMFFLAGLLLQISFGPLNNFFALYLRDLHYPAYAVGLMLGIGIIAEIIVFIFAGRLFQHFSLKSLLVFSLAISIVRWFLVASVGDIAWLLTVSQILHAFSFGLYHSASMQFLHRHFNHNQQNRGQAIYIGGVYGVGGAIGAYVTGLVWLDGQGGQLAFYIAAVAALIGTLFALLIPAKSTALLNR